MVRCTTYRCNGKPEQLKPVATDEDTPGNYRCPVCLRYYLFRGGVSAADNDIVIVEDTIGKTGATEA